MQQKTGNQYALRALKIQQGKKKEKEIRKNPMRRQNT